MTYILDIVLTPTEATRRYIGNQLHHKEQATPNFYKYAIRRDDEPDSWVFRFSSIQGVGETLGALNAPVVVGVAA